MGAVTVVPLGPVIREILRGATKPMTHHDIVDRLLSVDIVAQPGEVSSVLAKMRDRKEVARKKVSKPAGRLGRRSVWAYSFVHLA